MLRFLGDKGGAIIIEDKDLNSKELLAGQKFLLYCTNKSGNFREDVPKLPLIIILLMQRIILLNFHIEVIKKHISL